jgi:hypothetical protein
MNADGKAKAGNSQDSALSPPAIRSFHESCLRFAPDSIGVYLRSSAANPVFI